MRAWPLAPLALALAACVGGDPGPAPPEPAPPAAVAKTPEEPAPGPTFLTGTLPGDHVPAFSAKVRRTDGAAVREETLDIPAAKGVTVLVVMSTKCPNCDEASGPLKRVETDFRPRGVDFVYLYPDRAEPAEEKIAWHARKGFRAGLSLDPGAAVAHLLEVNQTPTVLVVGRKGVIVYRGGIAETPAGGGPAKHFLADALDEHLAGRPVSVPSTEPVG